MENEIVVEIRGVTASGKSTLVQLFEQVLAVHGIEVEVTYFDARPPPSEQTYRLKALRESGLKVHIIEKQTTKEEHCGFWKCEDCQLPQVPVDLVTKGDHHGGLKRVCVDRNACHQREKLNR